MGVSALRGVRNITRESSEERRRFAPAELMKVTKSISARELFGAFPELRRQLRGAELWEDGYAVRAVSDQVTEAIVRRYGVSEFAPLRAIIFTRLF